MARNTGTESRKGAVSGRSQIYNPTTGNYIKRDTTTGQFLDVKSDGTPFKGVRKEKAQFKANPSIDRNTALKVEKAVIAVMNRRNAK